MHFQYGNKHVSSSTHETKNKKHCKQSKRETDRKNCHSEIIWGLEANYSNRRIRGERWNAFTSRFLPINTLERLELHNIEHSESVLIQFRVFRGKHCTILQNDLTFLYFTFACCFPIFLVRYKHRHCQKK